MNPLAPILARSESVTDEFCSHPISLNQDAGRILRAKLDDPTSDLLKLCAIEEDSDSPTFASQGHDNVSQNEQTFSQDFGFRTHMIGTQHEMQYELQGPELSTALPSHPKRKSVDDFLSNDLCRAQSLNEFLSSPDPNFGVDMEVDIKEDYCTQQDYERFSQKPRTSKGKVRHEAKALDHITTSDPSDSSETRGLKSTSKRVSSQTSSPTLSSPEDLDERERRRRAQNREAQRRFRERGRYRAFQDFSKRLHAAVLTSFLPPPPPFEPPGARASSNNPSQTMATPW